MHVCEVSSDYQLENVVPYFQPIMDLQKDVVWGYECLARLIDQGQQVYLPAEFLYLLQKDSCYGDLTRKIFHDSAQYFRNVQVNWSINITEKDVINPQTIGFLQHYLTDYPNAHRVMLEIGASTIFQHPAEFKAFILLGKTLGIQIIIDRFEEPFRQLEKVLDYPIDAVKIDSKLLSEDEVSNNLFLKLQDKADRNDIAIIAEHIENGDILLKTRNINVRYGQGFFLSHPKSAVI